MYSGTSLVAKTVKRLPTVQETRVRSLGQEDPLEKDLPGKSHGQRSVVGYSPWGRKESDTTERLHFTSLHMTKQKRDKISTKNNHNLSINL